MGRCALGRALEDRTVVVQCARRDLEAGVEQEVGLRRVVHHLDAEIVEHAQVAADGEQHAAPAEIAKARLGAVPQQIPGGLARGHHRIEHRDVEAHLGEAAPVQRGAPAGIGQHHQPLVAPLQLGQRRHRLGQRLAPVVDHAPLVEQEALVAVGERADAVDEAGRGHAARCLSRRLRVRMG